MFYVHCEHLELHLDKLTQQAATSPPQQITFQNYSQYIKQHRVFFLITTLGSMTISVALQYANESFGNFIFQSNNNSEIAQTSVAGVGSFYPLFFFVHHLTAAAYKNLNPKDQNLIKNLFAITHDLLTCMVYSQIGSSILKTDLNFFINFGAPIISLCVTLIFLSTEILTGKSFVFAARDGLVSAKNKATSLCFSKTANQVQQPLSTAATLATTQIGTTLTSTPNREQQVTTYNTLSLV